MALPQENISMALFCDFENVALGVRDAKYDKFDIKKVLERLLLKGSIVVKKAYCDWDRYRNFKGTMHEANFELIEIPHVRQSGKNSADIRMVVDALDLCYTKSHVNTFVIISGDSDFSPLVSKLRENAKYVIGVGVKQSTSDLLTANCDEFIFYDDLVREGQRVAARRESRESQPSSAPRRTPEEERRRKEEMDARRGKAIDMAVETYEALVTDRDDGGRIWASVLKEALKRRNPGWSEQYYGFRTFGNLLEEAQARGLLEFGRDEKSGTYVYRHHGAALRTAEQAVSVAQAGVSTEVAAERQAERPVENGEERGGERGQERQRERGGNDRHGERRPDRQHGRQGERHGERQAERQGERSNDRPHDRHAEARGAERDVAAAVAGATGAVGLDAPTAAELHEQDRAQERAPARGRRRRRGEGDGASRGQDTASGGHSRPSVAESWGDEPSDREPDRTARSHDTALTESNGQPRSDDAAPATTDDARRRPARGGRRPASNKAQADTGAAARVEEAPPAAPAAAEPAPPAAKAASRSRARPAARSTDGAEPEAASPVAAKKAAPRSRKPRAKAQDGND
ncbi:MAG: NYN domain-containing protein [Rubrivivax sp.]|nr:MAG: NYN domain-containing protein [Rubrivivax sp.]